MITVNDFFEQEKICEYKGETYSVRDNGAVMRHIREGKVQRKMDGIWTFGDKNDKNGYMYLGMARIHRIVAAAFLDKEPSPAHVIDHIDTNKCNNRPDNLRWVTRLENALSNPITRKRIILCCGSIENFLANPASLRTSSVGQMFDWMRTVSPEEAKISKDNLERWAKEDSVPTGRGKLGNWIFNHEHNTNLEQDKETDIPLETKSLTQNVMQIDWKTPCEFPLCPVHSTQKPLQEYLENLKENAIFTTNQYCNSKVIKADWNKDKNSLFVMTCFDSKSAVKQYALAKITYNETNHMYYHTSIGTYFMEESAEKYFTTERGYEWTGGDVFDDFC